MMYRIDDKFYSAEEIEEKFKNLNLPSEKQWENLTLANDYLFGNIMQDIDLCTEMMRRILPALNIGEIHFVEIQKPVKPGVDSLGVRFDMYIESDDKKVYDVEIQTSDDVNLPRRTRAYHLAMGNNLLKRGVDYVNLPDSFVIFICTFDPFKKGRHVYTFKNLCCEDKKLALNDGAFTVFLNARGKMNDADSKMKAFLDFLMGRECEDPFIQELKKRLEISKLSRERRYVYMINSIKESAIRYNEHLKSFAQGKAEEKFETVRRLYTLGADENFIHQATNMPIEEIRKLSV